MGNDTILAFNRELAKRVGVNAALLYQELQRKYFYWKSQGKLKNGMFWCDQGALAEWILVHHNTVGKLADKLEEEGLIVHKVSYRPGTLTPTTWWKVVNPEITVKVDSGNHSDSDFHIKANTTTDTGEWGDDDASINTIPFAAPTTSFVEVETYASGDNDKTIVVKREIPRKYWNNAVKIWRKDERKFARIEFKDEPGKVTKLRPSQIKSWNVRPQTQSLGYDRNAGTAFGVSHD